MWRVSVRPTTESGLQPVDVVVTAERGGSVADLAAGLGRHIAGSSVLLAPVTAGVPWPAQTPLAEAPLRDGDVIEVASVGPDWLDRPTPTSAPRAIVQVLTGSDAGTQVPLRSEVATIGRGADATVRLNDPLVSRTHARLILGPEPVISDEGSAHGTQVAGRPAVRPQPVSWGEPITVGSTVIALQPGRAADSTAQRSIWRSPRFGTAVAGTEVQFPTPPSQPHRQPFPWPMILMPLLMGGVMFLTMRNAYSLVFMIGFPMMMVVTHLMQRRTAKREFAEETRIWREDLAVILTTLDQAAQHQRANAVDDDPEPRVVSDRATSADRAVWVRQSDDDDFLHLRAGIGPRPALVTGDAKQQGDRALRAEAAEEAARRATLPDMPVTVPLGPLTAVVGEGEQLDAWLRAALIRLAVTHSPNDVRVVAVLGQEHARMESWLRWLPHAAPLAGGLASVAIGAGDGQALLEELARTVGGVEHVVCLIDSAAGVPRRTLEGVAAIAEDSRLHLIWVGDDLARVPAATDAAIDLPRSSIQHADRGGVDAITRLDALDLASAWRSARALGGYRDEAAVLAGESALPDRVRIADLSSDLADLDDAEAIAQRWASSRGLRAQLGVGADGVCSIDLREDGPHGLVAGTTGAGKSELLQSLLCSLALNNPPSRITFLLVDYKGGAAFRECAQLPHTVGYITDLTPALVQRALTSLHAELTTREHLLAEYGAKDLPALERMHPEIAPPSMLICVDEFAALLAEVPDFIDGMVSIAQRGRSLGMHMILATQRPAGVVTPQIKANTDLRIALRVASPDDSTDVVDAPDAANLSRRTPGRALLRRTGHGTREMVQVAYVGGTEQLHDAGERVRVAPFTARAIDGGAVDAGRPHEHSDLERIVTTVTTAFLRSGMQAPRRPWIPPLPEELPLAVVEPGRLVIGADARDEAAIADSGADATVVEQAPGTVLLGLQDVPGEQRQVPWSIDYGRTGHLLVFGASGSGKTELLRTVAASVTAGAERAAACVYGIDAGGGGLTVLERLGSVGSIVVEQSTERMLRLIRMVHRTVTERNAMLASHGVADLDALAATGVHVQRIHLLIDNLPAVLDSLEGGGAMRRQHADQLLTVLQEGRRCGVHITATAPQRTGVPSQILAAFGGRVVMRMSVEDDYAMLGVPTGVLDRESPAGRGLFGPHEVQVATLGGAGTPLQAERLDELGTHLGDRYDEVAATAVPVMPTRLPQSVLPRPQRDELVLGVEQDVVAPVSLRLCDGPILLTGRARSGRTSALIGLAQLARRAEDPAEVVLIAPRGGSDEMPAVADRMITDAAEAAAWAQDAATRVDGEGWMLVLVDDVHEWERAWDANGDERRALENLTALLSLPDVAVVVAGDPDELRSRQHIPSLASAVKRSRRAMLIAPEMGDGSLVGAQVPMNSHEPMAGTGRGLLVAGGQIQVVQLISGALEERS
ncbi:FtsK/SpoIIIE domain-containing protein [Microbacterium sp. ARD32]|uniref:FtsK/SpoIIIE domain-containing protein n=1 Tax=Microbacterium sp. ARD32 TaxID=2962577 RepID=UPI0028823D14|nr:FtsK/SpoIIIE domain-containing protein [Microbacterium sp. ARD32]MDT0157722.1 FtsK/SpoIIIE domain-containing protein [Microbacterium sp. ARD32]